MYKFNFTYFVPFILAFVLLFSGVSVAQTIINLPQACNCPAGSSVSTNGGSVVSNYGNSSCANPSQGTINGIMTQGIPVAGVTMSLYANVTTLGSYSLLASNNGVSFSASGTFTTLGCQLVTLTASGTPTVAGPFTWCTNTAPQGCSPATVASATDASTNGTGIVSAYGGAGCTGSGTINGSMTQGVAVSGVTMTLFANVTQIGTWSLSAAQNGVTFSGSGTFTTTGCQSITLTASGTPTASGSFTWTTNSNPSGSGTATVVAVAGTITGLTCASATNAGTLTGGVAASGVSSTVPYTGGNGGIYSTFSVVSTGVTGLTATINAGTFAVGSGNLTVTISGNPAVGGTASFALNIGGQICTLNRNVAAPFNPSGMTLGVGSLKGRTCFDIALSNDNTNSCAPLIQRTPTQADFTLPAIHTQTYTFTPTGTVSNLRFYYINDVGNAVLAITGGNAGNNISTAQTATVNYNTNNNTLALGLTNSNPMTTRIFAVYNINATNNNNPADDRVLSLTTNVKDCACCGAFVAAGVWKEFLCHNLGAITSLDPHDMAQISAWGLNGAYIQWGKRGPNTTGDSRVDWVNAPPDGSLGFAAAPAGSATPNSAVVSGWSTTTAPDNAWRTFSGTKTANDPCPTGWRIPTSVEWTDVNNNNTVSRSGTWASSPTNYGSALHYGPDASTKLLTLPAGGSRLYNTGALANRASTAYYWTSTESTTNAFSVYINAAAVAPTQPLTRLAGGLIRCIAE